MDLITMSLGNVSDDSNIEKEDSALNGTILQDLPWEEFESETQLPRVELEIDRKAKNFRNLNLVSGNRIDGGLTESYVKEHYGIRGVQRYRLAKAILPRVNYNCSDDVLLMLSCTAPAKIVVATAGAGKTTSLQLDIVISKILDSATKEGVLEPESVEGTGVKLSRILYLNYNKHNVQEIEKRHRQLCSAVSDILSGDSSVDNNIESSTVHAFCYKWLTVYSENTDIPALDIISEEKKQQVWEAIITPRWKKYYGSEESIIVEYSVLDELYNYKVESMLDWDDLFETAKFVDTGLKPEFVKPCLKKYDSMKRSMKLMDFTDYLVYMIELLKTNPEIKNTLQDRYRLIIADENQDFTKLMNELLIQLYDSKKNKLIVVGDPDQTIYEFKGVSPDNIVELTRAIDGAEVLGLDTNYRCPDHIVEAAKRLLAMNILRFEKPINTVLTGGKIFSHPISDNTRQDVAVLQLLKRIGKENWINTVISYRNNVSSLIITEELYYEGIPFNILDSRRPFTNPVFKHISTALRALLVKDDFELNSTLYRFLPMKKEDWVAILNANKRQRRLHFQDLKYPMDMPRGAEEALKVLLHISTIIDTSPVCDFIGIFIRLYRAYYFDFILNQKTFVVNDIDSYTIYLERAIKFFSRHMTYEFMMDEMAERNKDDAGGVTLSTFHGLKGLEFDYVIAIDFMDSIFPKFSDIDEHYSLNTAMQEKEAANRLCYVLLTRTIREFHMFYSANDPSVYVNIINKPTDSEQTEDKQELVMEPVSNFDSSTSKMDFVKRLLGGR